MSDIYTDLLLRIYPFEEVEGHYPVEAELGDGSRFTGGQLKLDREALLAQQLDPEAYGLTLFNALFAGDIRRAYDKATGAAEANTGGRLRVRLWVDNDAVELHAVPWERLYHLHKGQTIPLGTSTLTPFSRYTSLEIREPQPITDQPIRMLVAVSNPLNLPGGLAPANVDLEIESLRRALDSLRKQNAVQVTVMPGRTGLTPALRSKLESEGYTIVDGPITLFHLAPQLMKCHIFHFIGHGAFRKAPNGSGGTAALYLEKVDGSWQAVKDEEIATMLAALGTLPHLTFLVACESAKREAGATSPFVGLGPKLVQAGIPAVVAMQEQVPVEMARVLSGEFYARLAEHGEVDRALNQARLQVFNKKSVEWAIPVLFMRIRKGRLFGADADDDAPAPGDPPFKGMEYFSENDASKFYGRELLTAKLAGKLRASRFLPIIIGASGSGKSSVIRAGLVPALRRGEKLIDGTLPPEGSPTWPIYICTPSTRPLESLAASLTREAVSVKATTDLLEDLRVDPQALHHYVRQWMSQRPTANKLLLIVDQFEETFTLCKDEAERRAFINNLIHASAETTNGPTVIIIIFRADFYAHCAQYDNLREAVATQQEFVGPMNKEELRRAIEEPARAGGWEFEPGLVDMILKEVGDEPGALPLMQHALLETWKRRRARTMTLRGYNEAGGIRGAIAKTAEAVFKDLAPEQQPIARRIFLRLVELGEGTQDTRRRARLEELWPKANDKPVVEIVLKKLVDNRLVVTTDKTAEVAHEALIREWPTLRGWIDASREGLRLHRDLLEAAEGWEKVNHDEGALYRGVRLGQAQEWAAANPDEVGRLEQAFLRASQEAIDRGIREKEEQQRRELEAAQKIAEEQKRAAAAEKKRAEEQTRSAARQRRLARIIAGVAVIAGIAAIVAVFLGFQSNRNAVRAENNAATAVFNEDLANQNAAQAAREARLAQGRELAAAAESNLTIDPELSLLLAMESVSTTGTLDQLVLPEAEDVLHHAIEASRVERTFNASDQLSRAVFSSDGRQAATIGDDGQVTLWSVATGEVISSWPAHDGAGTVVAYAPDDTRLLTAGDDALVKIWALPVTQAAPEPALVLEASDIVWAANFSPDGNQIVTGDDLGNATLWDAETGEAHLSFTGHADSGADYVSIYGVTFNPDGTRVASVGLDNTARVWNAATGEELLAFVHDDWVYDVAFSPDGHSLATASADRTARVWDLESGQLKLTLFGHRDQVTGVAFSPDGQRLATASDDRTVRLWEAATGQPLYTLVGHSKGVAKVMFDVSGDHLISASRDLTARVWDVSPASGREFNILLGHEDLVYAVTYSPDGAHIATASADGTARVWDAQTGEEQQVYTGHAGQVLDITYSPDGKFIATASEDFTAQVWSAATGETTLTLEGHTDWVNAVAYSPDGKFIATASDDLTARIWDATTGAELLPLEQADWVKDVAFSPDGKILATANSDGTAALWDAVTGEQLHSLTGHLFEVKRLAFSPDGKLLATASGDNTAKVWDVATGQETFSLSGHVGELKWVTFSPDGLRLATAAADKTVSLWEAGTGRRLVTLASHTGEARAVAYSPDGRYLATASADATVRLYVMPIDDLMNLARARLTRTFTNAECQQFLRHTCPAGP